MSEGVPRDEMGEVTNVQVVNVRHMAIESHKMTQSH